MNILLNQPIRFWLSGQRESAFKMPCLDSTELQFQIQATDIYGDYTDWARNGDFSSATGWTLSGAPTMAITGGQLTGTATTLIVCQNNYIMKAGDTYRLTVVISENTSSIYLDQDQNFYFNSVGTYTVIYKPNSNEKVKMNFVNGSFTVDSLKIENITDNYAFKSYLALTDGTHQQDISLTSIDRNFLTYSLLFSSYGLSYVNYDIKILDPFNNSGCQCLVKNGRFTNKEDSPSFIWEPTLVGANSFQVLQDSVTYDNELNFNSLIASTGNYLSQPSVLTDGVEYTVSFEIISLSNVSIDVFVGTNSTSYSTTGVKTTTLTCAGNTDLTFEFISTDLGSAVIKNISICITDEANYSSDYESNILDYRLNICNYLEVRCVFNNDCLGLGDAANFRPTALYPITIKNAEYEDDELNYIDSSGKRSVYFFTQRKNKTAETEAIAEYMHDFLSIMKGFDNVYIGPKQYSMNDQYTVDYISDDYGYSQFQISEKTQNRISNNKTISSVGIDISSEGSYLIDPNGNKIVDPSGNLITIP